MKNNWLLFGGSNKVGNIVGYMSLGKQVTRAYQGEVRNPRTTAQVLQRAKFKALLVASRMFVGAYRLGLKDEARSRKRTAYSQFMAVNAVNVTGSNPDALTINHEAMVCAVGIIPNMVLDSDHIDQTSVPGTISVAVQDRNSGSFLSRDDDEFYLVATCPELNQGCIGTKVARGSATELEVTPPSVWNGHKVYIYIFGLGTAGDNQGKSSNSDHVGAIDFVIE